MINVRKYTQVVPQPVRFGIRRVVFRGSQTTCVLCGSSTRGFIGHGGGSDVLERRQVVGGRYRADDSCPVCHGKDRTRMMMMYLQNEAGDGRHQLDILHVAPEDGLYRWLTGQPSVDYTGSDIDARRYRHIPNMHTADLTAAPFETESFDLVICSHVLEHIPDDEKALTEILRILKPGGRALLLVPLALDGLGTEEDRSIDDAAEQDLRFGQWDHVRLYGRDDFLARMTAAGFEVSVYDPFEENADRAEELHLNPDEILPIGRKPSTT